MTALATALKGERSLAFDAALVVGGSLVVAASAQIEIPLWPVPFTAQTLAVLLVGAALGAVRGGTALGLYLAQGAAGLPFFAGGRSGAAYLFQANPLHTTGGYLWGFLVAAVLVGFLAERGWDRRVGSALGAMFLGNVVIYAIGLPWLATALGMPVREAMVHGLHPFIVGDTIKLLTAGALLPLAWRLTRRPS